MKKILVVLGGGRPRGNTRQLVDAFINGVEDAGNEVELVNLNKLHVNGCMGCNACRYEKPCVQKDDFNSLVPKIKSADCIAFASPMMFWSFSAKIKAFIERFYCIAQYDNHPPYGRYEKYPVHDSVLMMTSADENFWTYSHVESYYRFLVKYIGFHDLGHLFAGGCGDTNGRPQIQKTSHLQEAFEFGKKLYQQ